MWTHDGYFEIPASERKDADAYQREHFTTDSDTFSLRIGRMESTREAQILGPAKMRIFEGRLPLTVRGVELELSDGWTLWARPKGTHGQFKRYAIGRPAKNPHHWFVMLEAPK